MRWPQFEGRSLQDWVSAKASSGELTREMLDDAFLQVLWGPWWRTVKEINGLPETQEGDER